jgi:hypothetical protein
MPTNEHHKLKNKTISILLQSKNKIQQYGRKKLPNLEVQREEENLQQKTRI